MAVPIAINSVTRPNDFRQLARKCGEHHRTVELRSKEHLADIERRNDLHKDLLLLVCLKPVSRQQCADFRKFGVSSEVLGDTVNKLSDKLP